MNLLNILILISSLSFLGYGIAYFRSPQMKSEFKRFGLEKAGALTAVLELLGAVGLLVGLKFHLILLISAGGLALLMFLGVAVRIKVKDSFWISLPALFFMILNAIIFFMSMPHSNPNKHFPNLKLQFKQQLLLSQIPGFMSKQMTPFIVSSVNV